MPTKFENPKRVADIRPQFFRSRKGFSIFLAMAITLLVVLMGVYLIEKLVPVSRVVKGVEQGNAAYYSARSGVERALFSLSGDAPGTDTGSSVGGLSTSGYAVSTVAKGSNVPASGLGNSEFDRNWNVLGTGKPVQLKLPAGAYPDNLEIRLRVPDVQHGDTDWTNTALSGGTNVGIVYWSVTASGDSLESQSGQLITADGAGGLPGINDWASTPITLGTRIGNVVSTNAPSSVAAFSTTRCAVDPCVLKLSLISPLFLTTGKPLPYLEYKITVPVGLGFSTIPEQWTHVSAEGYVRGFKRTVQEDVEQGTTNEALDFTVFQ
jgi:hypothetical protein